MYESIYDKYRSPADKDSDDATTPEKEEPATATAEAAAPPLVTFEAGEEIKDEEVDALLAELEGNDETSSCLMESKLIAADDQSTPDVVMEARQQQIDNRSRNEIFIFPGQQFLAFLGLLKDLLLVLVKGYTLRPINLNWKPASCYRHFFLLENSIRTIRILGFMNFLACVFTLFSLCTSESLLEGL